MQAGTNRTRLGGVRGLGCTHLVELPRTLVSGAPPASAREGDAEGGRERGWLVKSLIKLLMEKSLIKSLREKSLITSLREKSLITSLMEGVGTQASGPLPG